MSHRTEHEIVVVIPCLNESQTIANVVAGFKEAVPKARIFVFDNASDDDTGIIAEAAGASVVMAPIRGKGNVIREMFRKIDSDVYVMVDGDDTYLPEDSPLLIQTLIENELDMVVGDRLSDAVYDSQNKRRFHGFGNRLVLKIINLLYSADCKDILSGYRVFSRRFVQNCPILVDGFEVETQLTIHALDKKLATKEVPIQYRERPAGSVSKLNTVSDGIRILRLIALLFKDYKPLQFFSSIGALFFILGLVFGSIPVFEYFQTGLISRFPLAILAAALEILAALAFCCGFILDTFARGAREQFELRIMNFNRQRPDTGAS